MARGYAWQRTIVACLILIFVSGALLPAVDSSDGSYADVPISGRVLRTLYGDLTLEEVRERDPLGLEHLEDGSRFFIVQFDGPVGDAHVKRLLEKGFLVHDYFPDFAYVVDLNGRHADELKRVEGVTGTSPFRYWMRTGPEYVPFLNGLEETPSGEFVVELFDDSPRTFDAINERFRITDAASDTRIFVRGSPDAWRLLLIDGVKWVEPKPLLILFNDVASGIMEADPLRNILGLDGTGQIVAISDSGLDTGVDNWSVSGDVHLDFDNRVIFSNWAGSSPNDNHGHGTHVAGSVGGDGTRSGGVIRGLAYNSTIFFQAIMDDYQNIAIPGNLSLLFKESYDAGARIHTNSWGYQGSYYHGAYTSSSFDVDWTMYNYPEMLVLYAAGNDGTDAGGGDGKIDPNSVSPPATAKSTLTVGASENVRGSGGLQSTWGSAFGYPRNPIRNDMVSNDSTGLAAFSSRGPTDDDRIKPEIVSPGTNILSTRSSVPGASASWGSYDQYYTYMGGTSMATPLTAGMAALVRQYFADHTDTPNASGALVKAAIINGGVDLTPGQYGGGNPVTKEVNSRPDNDQGWGRANLAGAVSPGTGIMTHYQDLVGLGTGENLTRMFRVISSDEVRFTLAWSDYPGAYFSGKQLVNDLDLRLTSPSGEVFCGNDLTYSNDSPDRVNPTEIVTVNDPEVGWWKLEVRAHVVPRGRQHFAVVGSGDITGILENSLRFDRDHYSTDDDTIRIGMTAMEIGGSGSISIIVTSTSTPGGVSVTLFEEEEGRFSGTLRTSNVTTSSPGRIYVRHNDTLRMEYNNPTYSLSINSSATAVRPLRAYMYPNRDLSLVFSLHDRLRIRVLSEVGAELFWRLEGTGIGDMPLVDDGSLYYRDEVKDDGNYSGLYTISEHMRVVSRIVLVARDPYLGDLQYPQVNVSIDTSVPRFPRNLTALVLEIGNSVLLGWDGDNVTDRDRYDVFINDTDTLPVLDEGAWIRIGDAHALSTFTIIEGLSDNVLYHFRLASVNLTGVRSSYSSWASAIPMDTKAPDVRLKDPQYVLGPLAVLEFETDEDTAMIEVEYYIDDDQNGIADDGREFVPACSSTGNWTIDWDTTTASGGPGDTRSMIIRFRAMDEVPNISPWTVLNGFSVDNTGPGTLMVFEEVPRITRQISHSFTGDTEALGNVEIRVNGELSSLERVGANGKFYFTIYLEEGENQLIVRSYDRYGAPGVVLEYPILLDTTLPCPVIGSDLPLQVNITNATYELSSNSYDPGGSQQYNRIGNTSWEFRGPRGHVTSSYADVLILRFHDLGVHRIRLTVLDIAGNRNETEMTITVVDHITPHVGIVGPLIVEEDTIVTYMPEENVDNDPFVDQDNDAFFWTVDDGSGFVRTMFRRQFMVTFPEPGYYNVTLNVTDRAQNVGSASIRVMVLDITPPLLTIDGPRQVWTARQVQYGLDATDNDASPDLEQARWELAFLDGGEVETMTLSGKMVDLTFEVPGNYTLTAFLSDRSGNNGSESITIRVMDSNGGSGNGNGGFPWIVIAIATAIVLAALAILLFVYVHRRPEISDVDWEEDEAWIEE
ncbi:MAG: S8 family serine peptidase [Candidatus Thermoplasmatota archaeon]|nr:S8 family serine peptidase [Candidatus Thermoplasmatota archaeon]